MVNITVIKPARKISIQPWHYHYYNRFTPPRRTKIKITNIIISFYWHSLSDMLDSNIYYDKILPFKKSIR